MKTVKIKLIDKEALKFILEEDASKGDLINIFDSSQVDLTIIRNQFAKIENELKENLRNKISATIKSEISNQIYASREYKALESAKQELNLLKQNQIQIKSNIEKETSLKVEAANAEEINLLKAQIKIFEFQKQSSINNAVAQATNILKEQNLAQQKQFMDKTKNFNIKLKSALDEVQIEANTKNAAHLKTESANAEEINLLKAQIKISKLQEQTNINNAIAQETNRLKAENLAQEKRLINNDRNFNDKLAIKISESKQLWKENYFQEVKTNVEQANSLLMNEKDKIINELKEEQEVLMRQKYSTNIKALGEGLENWIDNEYKNYSLLFNQCQFSKTNISKSGSKPDFQFIVNNDNDLQVANVIIEAKTESNLSQESNKRKNASHLAKLWKDQKSHQADYSILVSELEMTSNNFLIQKVNDLNYVNMFIVRPQYLIPLLALIKDFAIKRSTIAKTDIKLKEKAEILADFDLFKEKLIKDFCTKIEKNVSTINNQAYKIKQSAIMIESKASEILDDVLLKLTDKINKYSIEKKVQSLKNID